MPYDKHNMCIRIEKDIRHKLLIIYTVKKKFFDKETTISGIVNDALREYFENHDEKIKDMMKKYNDNGGCFDL